MSSTTEPGRVAVVGGGISGIAAAHFLSVAGRTPEIIERDPLLGGRIAPGRLNGHNVAFGGKNIGHRYHLFRAFAKAHGDPAYEHIGVNTARVADGQLKVIDSDRRARSFLAQLSRLSPTDLTRFGCMALRVKWDEREGFLGGAGVRRLAERRDDPVVSSLFTPEFCRETWRPMSLLMNAAEPDEIHLGSLGTNVSMALDDYDQLRDGMNPLLERFGAGVATRLETRVESLVVTDGRVSGLRLVGPGGDSDQLDCDEVVLALTAHAAAELVAPHAPELAAELGAVSYFPTLVIVAEYDRDIFRPEVRSLRFDDGPLSNARSYGKEMLNTIRYTFSGKAARPLLAGELDPESLLSEAEARLGEHFGVAEARRVAWAAPPRALELCAYSPFHAARLDRIHTLLEGLPGLHLTGDFLRGASIEACFRAANDCVTRLVAAHALSHHPSRSAPHALVS